MIISDKKIEEFRKIYREVYGKEITKEKAYEDGMKLIVFLKEILKPMTPEKFEAMQNRRIKTLPNVLDDLVASQGKNEGI